MSRGGRCVHCMAGSCGIAACGASILDKTQTAHVRVRPSRLFGPSASPRQRSNGRAPRESESASPVSRTGYRPAACGAAATMPQWPSNTALPVPGRRTQSGARGN
eukprot:scaffold1200_cov236-Isochrysis_galbana.AAC.3